MRAMFRSKQTCLGCHFLAKEARSLQSPQPVSLHVSAEERRRASQGDFSWAGEPWALTCSYGVWDEGYESPKDQRFDTIAKTNRRHFCFYFDYRPGMFFPAAKLLQERQAQAKAAAREHRLVIYGLWIAAASILASLVVQVSQTLGWWPFVP